MANHILNSWKEIAIYLSRGVRTVQRWEADLGLPVRRPKGKAHSSVIALPSEIDLWLQSCPLRSKPSTTPTPLSIKAPAVSKPTPLLFLDSSKINSPDPTPRQNDFRSLRRPWLSAKVLLIDADRQIASLRKRILENEGYVVTLVIWPRKMPREFHSFNAIVLGHTIPTDHRHAISRTIRERAAEILIVMICSQPGEIDPAATLCLPPLVDPEGMINALQEFLSASRRTKSRTSAN